MPLHHPKVLAVCLGGGLALGGLAGAAFALLARRDVTYGVGIGLMVVGVVALFGALLGATEPPEGWRTRTSDDRRAQTGRRSLAARAAESHSAIGPVSSMGMVVWGAVVGGGLIAVATLVFELAGSAR